jgi:hypothetical protein
MADIFLESRFEVLPHVKCNRFANAFYKILNLQTTVEPLILISLIQEIWLAEPEGINWILFTVVQ